MTDHQHVSWPRSRYGSAVFFFLSLLPSWFFRRLILFLGVSFLFWFIEIFLLFVEYFFFDEFRSRFNTVAVDYLLYPQEVFINIWDTYPVVWVVAACLLVSVLWRLVL